jgi:hypothetical protein
VEYNTERPHSALGYGPPAPQAILPKQRHGDVENAPRFPHPHIPGDDYRQMFNEALHSHPLLQKIGQVRRTSETRG